jgi:phage recombination protein Bet
MSAAATVPAKNGQQTNEVVAAIPPPRLPYHPEIETRFGVTRAQWKALVEAVFPLATSTNSIVLALSYCKARNLDIFKRNVHIVPIWNSQLNKMVDTIWPGIGELRTTAFRTREYAGRGDTLFGPDVTEKIGNAEVTYPEWAQVTVNRLVNGEAVSFAGPRVYWKETYATAKRNDATPNSMWLRRPRGQLDKCAEAAALRAAFPEEIGNEHTDDEVGVAAASPLTEVVPSQPTQGVSALESKLGLMPEAPTEHVDDEGEIHDGPLVPTETPTPTQDEATTLGEVKQNGEDVPADSFVLDMEKSATPVKAPSKSSKR